MTEQQKLHPVLPNDNMQEPSHFLVINKRSKQKYYLHLKKPLQARTRHLKKKKKNYA